MGNCACFTTENRRVTDSTKQSQPKEIIIKIPRKKNEEDYFQENQNDIDFKIKSILQNAHSLHNLTQSSNSLSISNKFHKKKNPFQKDFIAMEVLGEDKTGKLILAKKTNSSESRCIKVIEKIGLENNVSGFDDISKTKREIEILSLLNHKNIIHFYGSYEDEDAFYLISEYFRGRNLLEEITSKKKCSENNIKLFIEEILRGLKHIHENKIVLVDLKAEGVIFSSVAQKLKISDFSSAVILPLNHNVTFPFSFYQAPEVKTRQISLKSDVWSLGIITHILLLGEPPFKKQRKMFNTSELCLNFNDKQWKKVSKEAKNFIQSCLQEKEEKRSSVNDLLIHSWFKSTTEEQKEALGEEFILACSSFQEKSKALNLIRYNICSLLDIEKKEQKLYEMFKMIDKNNDGVITKEEMKEIMGNMTIKIGDLQIDHKKFNQIFEKMDIDNSGTIDLKEFIAAFKKIEIEENIFYLKQAFFVLTGDQEKMDIDTLKQILGQNENEQLVEEFMQKYDNDKNGVIDFQEFLEMIQEQ